MCRVWIGLTHLMLPCLIVSAAGAFDGAAAVRAVMLRATDLILNLDADAAEAECRPLLALPQGEAAGRFCLGLATLTRAEDKDDPAPDMDRFLEQAADAVLAAEALERAEPTDAEVKLLVGLIHGSKALADAARKNYLAALRGLRAAHQRFRGALQLDPTMVDAAYGIGLYHYALGQMPALLRPLVAVVLPAGDPSNGISELQRVAENGTYLKTTARMVLLRLYAGPEQKYAEALRLGRDLLQRYPGNPDLYFATAHAASELGHFSEALEIARRISRNMADTHPRFTPALLARYNQLMGKVYMDHGEYATALTFFQRAIQAPTPPRYLWVTAWAWTRSGMIYDLQGNRDEAIRRYRMALAVETEGSARDLAQRHLEVPYRGRTRPVS